MAHVSPIGQILADAAAVDVFLGVHNGRGKGFSASSSGQGQNMKRQPLRALAPDTGQRGELVDAGSSSAFGKK